MKIHYLSGSRVPSTDANSIHVVKMCSAFVANGHAVRLFCRDLGSLSGIDLGKAYGLSHAFPVSGLRYSTLPLYGSWKYSRDVRDLAVNDGLPDIFYGRNLHALSMVRGFDVPLIYECHAPPESYWQKRALARLIDSKVLRRVIAISAALSRELVRQYPRLDSRLLKVAHDAADEPESSVDHPAEIPGRRDAVHVGYAGHLYKGKGMELIPSLARGLPEMDFHVVGGTAADVERWKATVSLSNLYFHGYVPHGKVNEYLRRFNVVLAPYQPAVFGVGGRDNVGPWMSPLKIFEYMANARPIVASDLPVIREILINRVNAILCPPDDPDTWIRCLRELANDLQLRTRLGARAREEFLAQYTWRARAAAVVS